MGESYKLWGEMAHCRFRCTDFSVLPEEALERYQLAKLNFRSINLLMTIAVIDAFYLGEYEKATVVINDEDSEAIKNGGRNFYYFTRLLPISRA